MRTDPYIARIHKALAKIPPRAVVSADYSLVPQLSHRPRIYMFPNPFRTSDWGVSDRDPDNPDDVEYVILTNLAGLEAERQSPDPLVLRNDFERIEGDGTYSLYRRIELPPIAANAGCGDLDGDGKITGVDFRMLAYAALHGRACPLVACDVDDNGRIDDADALRVARRVRDPETALTCPPPAPVAARTDPRS